MADKKYVLKPCPFCGGTGAVTFYSPRKDGKTMKEIYGIKQTKEDKSDEIS